MSFLTLPSVQKPRTSEVIRSFLGTGFFSFLGLGFGIGAFFGQYSLGSTFMYLPSPTTGFLYVAFVGGNGAHGRCLFSFIELFNLLPYPFHPLHIQDVIAADTSALDASVSEWALFAGGHVAIAVYIRHLRSHLLIDGSCEL